MLPLLASKKECTGCLSCVQACMANALKVHLDEDGHYMIRIHENCCVGCHLCEKKCPVVQNYIYGNNNLGLSRPYAAWAKDDLLRQNSSSGGVFAALAVSILKQGGCVAGAEMNDLECRHILIEKTDDLFRLQGTKYLQSYIGNIYNEVRGQLKKGRTVLFSGTPCQNAALLNYLPEQERERLFCVDVVCSHVPSHKLVDLLVEHTEPAINKIVSFRNKRNGWKPLGYTYELTVSDQLGQRKVVPEKNILLKGFTAGQTGRYSCYHCRYAYAHRKSDFTIGDLWGDKLFTKQHFNGVSLAIVHSRKGLELLKKSEVEMHPVDWKDILSFNTRIVCGKKKIMIERRILSLVLKYFPYSLIKLVYANIYSRKNVFAICYVITRKIRIAIYGKRLKNVIQTILKTNNNG